MLIADLYQNTIELDRYMTPSDCRACGFLSREEFLESLRKGEIGRACSSHLDPQRLKALRIAAHPDTIIPQVEVLQLPDPGPTGLFPINNPRPDSHVLVSGNSRLTIEVLSAVLSTTISAFWYLVVDTDGHTIDMALIFKTFTADRIHNAMAGNSLDVRNIPSTLHIPGLAASLKEEITNLSGWSVQVGPICAAGLPLYFGASWQMRE